MKTSVSAKRYQFASQLRYLYGIAEGLDIFRKSILFDLSHFQDCIFWGEGRGEGVRP